LLRRLNNFAQGTLYLGHRRFTCRLIADLLTVSEFANATFACTDLNSYNLDRVKQLAERDITENSLPAKTVVGFCTL
jgi:hypothetical protein